MKKQTQATKQSTITRDWYKVDVKDQVLGRISVEIAHKLMGKGKPYFVNNLDCGDYVVVVNAKEVRVTGGKDLKKVYTRYSGYPGGLRSETLGEKRARKPEDIIRLAVSGMLPKNRLRAQMLKRLYIFAEETNQYEDKLKKA